MISHEQKKKILEQFSQTLPPAPPEDGILLLDKPSGPTSHDIVYAIRKKYSIKKVGHTGTLDPLASGLMILLLGKATKRAKEFEGLDKVYEVEAVLGQARDTYDAEGQVTAEVEPKILKTITRQKVKAALPGFVGPQKQKVPPFSAVKLNGKPLYKYAREGNPIPDDQLPVKEIEIYSIELLVFSPSNPLATDKLEQLPKLHLRIHCSKGTYIRTLVHELGETLSYYSTVIGLKRVRVGSYSLDQIHLKPHSQHRLVLSTK